jgi:hypothetical protein
LEFENRRLNILLRRSKKSMPPFHMIKFIKQESAQGT